MNQASKARIANIFTAIVTILPLIQGTLLTKPPFTDHAIFVLSTVFTYLVMALTAWKQYLSPDVSKTGQNVTFWVAGIATIAGLTDLVGIAHFNDKTAQYVKLCISIAVMIMNVVSKQLFPSFDQKVKMNELKQTDSK